MAAVFDAIRSKNSLGSAFRWSVASVTALSKSLMLVSRAAIFSFSVAIASYALSIVISASKVSVPIISSCHHLNQADYCSIPSCGHPLSVLPSKFLPTVNFVTREVTE